MENLEAESLEGKSGEAFDRTIFDAIPIPAFVVDDDMQILELNVAAAEFCGQSLVGVYERRGGEVLHCLHTTDVIEGCGRGPICAECVFRNSVTKCLEGQTVSRKIMNLQFSSELAAKDMQILITASPLQIGGKTRALVIVEDITEIITLKSLLPTCMMCKKVRDDEQFWTTLEEYFHQHGVDFSHGICPACAEKHYSEYYQKRD
jgi:PAS domain-containing protein